MARDLIPQGYAELLAHLTQRIRESQVRAALSVNRELVLLYWRIGREISIRMRERGWGAKVVDRLARDLKHEFPEMKGFSPRNLRYMRAFAEAYPDEAMLQAAPAKMTWYHNSTLLDKVKDPPERAWYMRAAVQFGWSRDVMVHQIESRLYQRQGKTVTDFERTLPALFLPRPPRAHVLPQACPARTSGRERSAETPSCPRQMLLRVLLAGVTLGELSRSPSARACTS